MSTRYAYIGTHKDQAGNLVPGGTISTFLAGTSTVANVYTASSGGSPVTSVTSDETTAKFVFYVDTADHAANQLFKITLSKTNYTPVSYDDIKIFPHAEPTTVTFADGDLTPSVKASNTFKTANTTPKTISDFDDEYDGQHITVLVNDSNTTFSFGSGLVGNAGADWTPVSGDYMDCRCIGTTWYCMPVDTTNVDWG